MRANLIGACDAAPRSADAFFNTGAFATVPSVAPGATGFGSAGRNVCTGAARNQWDISLFKNFTGIPFPVNREGANLQFRTEFFNAFNHTQFNNYFTTFGQTGFGRASRAFEPRILQFALKLTF